MAMQVSITRKDDSGEQEKHGFRHTAATWAVAAIDELGRGLAWIFVKLQNVRHREGKRKQIQLVESLMLGNRRQLLLVVCSGQRYLVGAGADSVGSILALEPGATSDDCAASAKRTTPWSAHGAAKGPELVRHKGRRIVSEQEAGSGLWP